MSRYITTKEAYFFVVRAGIERSAYISDLQSEERIKYDMASKIYIVQKVEGDWIPGYNEYVHVMKKDLKMAIADAGVKS